MMKTIKELEGEAKSHENNRASYHIIYKQGQISALKDVLKLIDDLYKKGKYPHNHDLLKLKARIKG